MRRLILATIFLLVASSASYAQRRQSFIPQAQSQRVAQAQLVLRMLATQEARRRAADLGYEAYQAYHHYQEVQRHLAEQRQFAQRRLETARTNESVLNRAANQANPSGRDADRLYRQAADATRARIRIQREVEPGRNYVGKTGPGKSDRWPPASSVASRRSESRNDAARSRDQAGDLQAPKWDSRFLDPRPSGGRPGDFKKEQPAPRETFTERKGNGSSAGKTDQYDYSRPHNGGHHPRD